MTTLDTRVRLIRSVDFENYCWMLAPLAAVPMVCLLIMWGHQ